MIVLQDSVHVWQAPKKKYHDGRCCGTKLLNSWWPGSRAGRIAPERIGPDRIPNVMPL